MAAQILIFAKKRDLVAIFMQKGAKHHLIFAQESCNLNYVLNIISNITQIR